MTLIDRQIDTIAAACAVTRETVAKVINGERVGDGPGERVRAALGLIGFIPPIPRVAMPVTVGCDRFADDADFKETLRWDLR